MSSREHTVLLSAVLASSTISTVQECIFVKKLERFFPFVSANSSGLPPLLVTLFLLTVVVFQPY